MSGLGRLAFFACGTLFGSAGLKILASDDAKKVYTHTTAAALRCKEETMTYVTSVRENCEDILEDAKKINEERAAKKEAEQEACIIEDAAETEKADVKAEPVGV